MINKKRLIKTTAALIQIDSQNPPGNEIKIAEFVKSETESLGLKVETFTFKPDRPNIVATLLGSWPTAKAKTEAILITPHYDTVPFGSGWKYPPLSGTVDKGRIYGRGASDDKGNLAVCMEVLHSLVEDGVKLKKNVIFAATADEETGSHWGIIPLLEKNLLKPRAALILDSDEFDAIICQKGLIHCRVQIMGKKAHAAYNWRGVNAIEIAARVIKCLTEHQFKFHRHPILHPPTKNIGKITGGDKVNMVADFCEFALDMRFLPGMEPEKILQEVKNIIRKEATRFKIEIDDLQYPYEIAANDSLVATYVQTARRMKIRTTIKGSEGATVITFFKKKGIPAFATGYGSRATAHTTDEYAEVDKLYKGARLLEQFLKEYDQR